MYDILRRKNEGMRGEVIDLARRLIRTPSPSLDESAVADIVETQMQRVGLDRVERDDWGNVIGVCHGREAAPTLLLCSHLDTVSPDVAGPWTESPYSGRIADGRIHGLGAGDCKGGLSAQIMSVALLKRCLLPLRGNLVVAATVAEEIGGSTGVRGLLDETLPALGLTPDYAILGEPTGLGLYYGHDGWAKIEIRVEGLDPFHLDDAAQAIYSNLSSADGLSRGAQRLAIRRPFLEESPQVCRAKICMDRRIGESEELDTVIGDLQKTASLASGGPHSVAVNVSVLQEKQHVYTGRSTVVRRHVNAWQTDPFHPLVERARQALAAADCEAKPGKWQLGRLGMGTAGGVLVKEFGIPTIGYGPGDEQTVHAPGENVAIPKLEKAVYGIAAISHALIGVPVFGWSGEDV